ncbi:MAG: hypothetical protein ACKVQQ_06380 [Burkholderiales bacterium]
MKSLPSDMMMLALLVSTSTAFGQTTLGDLLVQGAKKVPIAEIQTKLTGMKVDSTSPAGFPMRLSFEPGGVVYSVVEVPSGARQFSGKWYVPEDGKVCTLFAANPESCAFYFSTEKAAFATRSESNKETPIRKMWDR